MYLYMHSIFDIVACIAYIKAYFKAPPGCCTNANRLPNNLVYLSDILLDSHLIAPSYISSVSWAESIASAALLSFVHAAVVQVVISSRQRQGPLLGLLPS